MNQKMRLRLDCFDHNERFARLLPRDGEVVRTAKSSNNTNTGWSSNLTQKLNLTVNVTATS